MRLNKQNISSFITRAFALVIYISFLGVQLFFNFDTGKGPTTTIHYYSATTQHSHSHSQVNQRNKNKEKQATVSLNKRFHPESILAFNTISIEVPICFTKRANKYFALDQHISTLNLLTRSLRGPPVVG